jgi:cytosine permease
MENFMKMPMSVAGPVQERTFVEEFEHEPVPLQRRHSLKSVVAVWFGFPMVLTQAVFGGIITYNLGFIEGASAILLGNLVLCLYVGALSYVAGSTGLNFAMQAKRTFGTKGYRVACGLLSTLVVGWYAFQTGLTGATIHTAFGWNTTAVIVVATLLFTATTFVGIRALAIVGIMAPTLFIIMGVIALGFASSKGGLVSIWHFKGAAHDMTFGGAITLVIAGFADAGTMTADFTRWSRNGREGFFASLSAFPVANAFAFLFGGVIVAAGAAINPAHNGGNFMPLLTGHGVLLTALALIFVFINLGSVCAHCLYNGAVGYSHLLKSRMRVLTLVLGILGGIAAVLGIWSLFPYWLSLLGIFVPPIGAVMIMDQLILGHAAKLRAATDFNPRAFVAWVTGSAVAIVFHIWMPQYGEALAGLIVSGAAYAALGRGHPSRAAVLDTIQ